MAPLVVVLREYFVVTSGNTRCSFYKIVAQIQGQVLACTRHISLWRKNWLGYVLLVVSKIGPEMGLHGAGKNKILPSFSVISNVKITEPRLNLAATLLTEYSVLYHSPSDFSAVSITNHWSLGLQTVRQRHNGSVVGKQQAFKENNQTRRHPR